jgi:hypothetical protein
VLEPRTDAILRLPDGAVVIEAFPVVSSCDGVPAVPLAPPPASPEKERILSLL